MEARNLLRLFLLGLALLELRAESIQYSLKKDKATGKFAVFFNDKTKAKKAKKSASKKHKNRRLKVQKNKKSRGSRKSRHLGIMDSIKSTLGLGGNDDKERKLLQSKIRSAGLKNELEQENLDNLFESKMEMESIARKVANMRGSFQFMLSKKYDMLQEVLPEISV